MRGDGGLGVVVVVASWAGVQVLRRVVFGDEDGRWAMGCSGWAVHYCTSMYRAYLFPRFFLFCYFQETIIYVNTIIMFIGKPDVARTNHRLRAS